MVWFQSKVDDFNDNSLDTSKWEILNSGVTESSQVLNIPATTNNPSVRSYISRTNYDISAGKLLAIKLTRSGTASSLATLKLGARDADSGAWIMLTCITNDTNFGIETGGGLTVGSSTGVETPSLGFGPSWVNGSWFAVGNMGSDNILHFYRSLNGTTWIEIAKTTLTGGTFNKVRCGLRMQCTLSSGTSTFVAQMDDASYFVDNVYSTFIIDDFADGTIDTSLWDLGGASGITETGGVLQIAAGPASTVRNLTAVKRTWDLNKGILAVKLSKSGTTNASVYTKFGVIDKNNKVYYVLGQTNAATMTGNSDASQGTPTNSATDTSVGLGPSWTNGTLLGLTYSRFENCIRLVKSTDAGVSWTEIYKTTYTGTITFDYRNCGLILATSNQSGGSSTMVMSFDDASYFLHSEYAKVKVRTSASPLLRAVVKVRVGGAWVPARVKARVGGAWVDVN